MTMLVIVPSHGIPLQRRVTALALCLAAVVVRDDRRRMGMLVNGYRRSATRPIALALAGVTIVLLMAELHARGAGLDEQAHRFRAHMGALRALAESAERAIAG